MTISITIRRDGFLIDDASFEKPRFVDFGKRSNIPLFVASLAGCPYPWKGVDAEFMRRQAAFRHLSPANFMRTVRSYIPTLAAKLGEELRGLLVVEQTTDRGHGSIRLVLAPDTSLRVAPELEELLRREQVSAADPPWMSLPAHDRVQLAVFVDAIQRAAAEFDGGDIDDAEKRLTAAINMVSESRYLAVIHFRLGRARLRSGNEDEAEVHVGRASDLIETLVPIDYVLQARVEYNRAWIAYTKGDFRYAPINRAQSALMWAMPDDLRHGYVATQHGLIVVKDLERNHGTLSSRELESKAREALALLTHAVYLLTRSEDFYGTQESCSNLANGLFRIGQVPSLAVAHVIGTREANYREILLWLERSDDVADKHFTGADSVRNHVLRAFVGMTLGNDLGVAFDHLKDADRLSAKTSPREIGRLHECWIEYHLHCADADPVKRNVHRLDALKSYDEASEIWSGNEKFEKLLKELGTRYRKTPSGLVRRRRLTK